MAVLDITADVCPMTFVRVRLALDRLHVRLRGEEPVTNVPRTLAEQGHSVISQTSDADGTVALVVRKG